MKLLKRSFLITIICLFITIIFVYWLNIGFQLQRDKILSVASVSFVRVIDQEKSIKMANVKQYSSYNPKLSPNDIPFEEKKSWCDQFYLTKYDPKRITLDSLYKTELAKNNIKLQTAIRFLIEGRTIYSCQDSMFYKSAMPLKSIVYRLNEKPEGRMELQAFVKLPFMVILKKVEHWEFIILLWGLLQISVLVIFFNRKRVAKMFAPIFSEKSKDTDSTSSVKNDSDKDQPPTPRIQASLEWTLIAEGLFFNFKFGMLRCEETTVALNGNGLRLFYHLLHAPDNFLTYREICYRVLKRKSDVLSSSDQTAVFMSIRRLRNDLTPFPFIKIESVRGKGYRMLVREDVVHPEFPIPEEESGPDSFSYPDMPE